MAKIDNLGFLYLEDLFKYPEVKKMIMCPYPMWKYLPSLKTKKRLIFLKKIKEQKKKNS